MSNQLNLRNVISAVGTLIVGIVVYLVIPIQIKVPSYSIGISFTTRTMPYLITLAIIVLSLTDIFLGLKEHRKKTKEETILAGPAQTHNYTGVLITFVSIFLWIVLTIYFGFRLATIFLVIATMLVIGNCKWWQIIFLSLILSFPLDYILKVVLRVYLPEGIFFE